MIADLPRLQRQQLVTLRPWISILAIAYVIVGYVAGLACIVSARPAAHLLRILLLAHTTVLSGLLAHELMHRAVFCRARTNDWFGAVLSLFNGGCYVPFALLRRQHVAHHVHQVGYDSFSITQWVRTLPAPVQSVLVALEFCYFPILTHISRARALVYPFVNPKYAPMRPRIALALCARTAVLAGLWAFQPWSLVSFDEEQYVASGVVVVVVDLSPPRIRGGARDPGRPGAARHADAAPTGRRALVRRARDRAAALEEPRRLRLARAPPALLAPERAQSVCSPHRRERRSVGPFTKGVETWRS